MEGPEQLAASYTHKAEQEGNQQQMPHRCHDRSLGRREGR